MKTLLLSLALSIGLLSLNLQADSKILTYQDGQFEGILFTPKKIAPHTPGILLIHNWMGITDETKTQALRFTKLGYIVFAADVYGKGVRPKTMEEAATLATKYKSNRPLFRKNLELGLEFLKSQPHVDSKKLAVLGYCFGGTGALELARTGSNVLGAISFHGGLDSLSPQDAKKISAKVMVHHGEIDPFQKSEDLNAFKKEMSDAHVALDFYAYPGAVHSFTEKAAGSDIKKGAAYNAEADQKSFDRTKDFLKKLFI